MAASVVAIAAAMAFSSALAAQTTRPSAVAQPASAKAQAAKSQAPKAYATDAKSFDPHDLNGIWVLTPRRQMAITENRPPMTPWGQAKLNQVRSSWTNAALGIKAAPESEWNDPLYKCDPAGYPRTMQQIFGEIM
jgi:hypothetical protein